MGDRASSDPTEHLNRVRAAIAGSKEEANQECLELRLIPRPAQPALQPMMNPIPALLAPALLLSGTDVPMLGWGRACIQRKQIQQGPEPQGFHCSNLGPDSTPIMENNMKNICIYIYTYSKSDKIDFKPKQTFESNEERHYILRKG